MCSNPFGILDDQLLFECPTEKCGEQYCHKCLQSIQGPLLEDHSITCMSCQKDVHPTMNQLIQQHLIWSRMSQSFGVHNLIELKKKTTFLSSQPVVKDMKLRLIHLQSRLETFRNNLPYQLMVNADDDNVINEVEDLCRKIQNLMNEMENIEKIIEEQDIDLQQISDDHQQAIEGFDNLCDKLTFSIKQLQMNDNERDVNATELNREELHQSYIQNKLVCLSTDHNVEGVDQSLLDLNARKQFLDFIVRTIHRLMSIQNSSNESSNKHLDNAKARIDEFDRLMNELNFLHRNLRTIERMTDRYIVLFYDKRQPNIPGSRFIYLLEMLCIETERLEIARAFPNTARLIDEWQNDDSVGDEFKPKVLDLCENIEEDLKNIFTNNKSIYSVPYRIGVIGYTSGGKSALIMKLANLSQYATMIDLDRSTFGYLQFDTHFDDHSTKKKIPISFIDIGGAIDTDLSPSIGNYLELISNSDCDVYMLVFDKPFDGQNQHWLDFIQNTLGRRCLLVRSKVDVVFQHFYQETTRKTYQASTAKNYHVQSTLQKTKEHCLKSFDDKDLSGPVFLTSAGRTSNDLDGAPFAEFDLQKLREILHDLALADKRLSRVSRLAILASKTAINTCFRRGYTVSKTKYRWLSAGASLIPLSSMKSRPFLDEKKFVKHTVFMIVLLW